ncbi:MAG: hypothetical protein L0Z53_16400 [Acidobacteriales bacterium]|nr:hypothetical protein [Terriglobales bacterium]
MEGSPGLQARVSVANSPHIRSGPGIALPAILLLALAVHGPLLLMQMPLGSYDANTHIFFASHYANHWFDPWNDKWYAGFSQTTYPPLTHQLIALFSHVLGLNLGYMLVQLIGILLLVAGVYSYAKLWVDERSASFAAIGSVFLGSLAMLVYQSGQLPTTFAAGLTLNAIPFFYRWLRDARLSGLLKGLLITMAAAAAHHVTLLFGAVLFFLPVLWLALVDRDREGADASVPGVISRAVVFAVFAGAAVAIVLLPYWIALIKNPIDQMPIPHGSRDNYLLNLTSGLNFWVIPMGALILALPWIFLRGASNRRLRPLFVGWYITMLIGLGGTTPVARLLLQRAFEVLTFERFTFWATLMALPMVGLLAARLIDRAPRRAPAALWVAAVLTFSFAVAWTAFRPINSSPFKIDEVIAFLNRDGHDKFRYITLGFGNNFSKVATSTNASSVDGDYNSARLLPELTAYGAGQLYNAKYFGASGMESLRAILKHANQYGLKYVFVRDRYYEPLLAFAGWRQTETYDNGNVTLWTRDDVQPAKKIESTMLLRPWEGLHWGTLPIASGVLALFLVIAIPERKRRAEMMEFPAASDEEIALREAR